ECGVVAAGEDRAGAVRLALSGIGPVQLPAAGARGRQRTLFLLDRAAASRLPPPLRPTSSLPSRPAPGGPPGSHGPASCPPGPPRAAAAGPQGGGPGRTGPGPPSAPPSRR